MKSDHEIFDAWWEYFLVAWWAFSNPTNEKLLKRKQLDENVIADKYEKRIGLSLRRRKESAKQLKEFCDRKLVLEEERKTTIEAKAHTLVGQTGIVVSILLGTLSLGASQNPGWPFYLKLLAWFLLVGIAIQFIICGLHARNAVTLIKGYANENIEDLLGLKATKEKDWLGKLYRAEYNSYLNDVKATYLKFAHWYFKCGLLLVLVTALVMPPLVIGLQSSNQKKTSSNGQQIIYESHRNETVGLDSSARSKPIDSTDLVRER